MAEHGHGEAAAAAAPGEAGEAGHGGSHGGEAEAGHGGSHGEAGPGHGGSHGAKVGEAEAGHGGSHGSEAGPGHGGSHGHGEAHGHAADGGVGQQGHEGQEAHVHGSNRQQGHEGQAHGHAADGDCCEDHGGKGQQGHEGQEGQEGHGHGHGHGHGQPENGSKDSNGKHKRNAEYTGVVAGKYQWDSVGKKGVADDDVAGEAISKYGWSDGKKAVSVYVEMSGLDDVPDENLSVESGEKRVRLTIEAVGQPPKRRTLTLPELSSEIEGVDLVRKKGKHTIVLKMKKREEKSWWKLLSGSSGGGYGGDDDV